MQLDPKEQDDAKAQQPEQSARNQAFWTILLLVGIGALIFVAYEIHSWWTTPLGFQG